MKNFLVIQRPSRAVIYDRNRGRFYEVAKFPYEFNFFLHNLKKKKLKNAKTNK